MKAAIEEYVKREETYELEKREDMEVQGLPTLNLDTMQGTTVNSDMEFLAVFGDIIMLRIVDESEKGEVWRDGIWIQKDMVKKLWRRGEVVLFGPKCVGVEKGDHLMYPSDKGLPFVSVDGNKYIFINMERVFAKVAKLTIPKN